MQHSESLKHVIVEDGHAQPDIPPSLFVLEATWFVHAALLVAENDRRPHRRTSPMMRLADHIAARRRLYARPIPTLPDILLLDIPDDHAGETLSLGHYYPILIETPDELDELTAFLEADRIQPVAPTLLDRRPSALVAQRITMARYPPAEPAWPWILLCHWPADIVRLAPDPDQSFARHAYTIEVFAHEDLLERSTSLLLATLAQHDVLPATILTAGLPTGSA